MTDLDVTVVVATYGAMTWSTLAQRALNSIPDEVPRVHIHLRDGQLHEARNHGLDHVSTEWVCFLDADDELEPGYLDQMALGSADVRAPAVRYVRHPAAKASARVPKVAGHVHDCTAECLQWGNWLIIGSLVRTEMVRVIGGFTNDEWSEDWRLWSRCWQLGATFEAIPAAVYRAHVRMDSRNRKPRREVKLAAHQRIARDLGFPVP